MIDPAKPKNESRELDYVQSFTSFMRITPLYGCSEVLIDLFVLVPKRVNWDPPSVSAEGHLAAAC